MRVDAHHHVWDLSRRKQPWLDGPWADPIRRTWTEADLRPHLAAHDIDATIVVQTSSSTDETRELLALAEQSARIAAVVGWADLTRPTEPTDPTGPTGPAAPYGPGPPPRLAGLRHQVQDEADPDWLARADVRRGLARVADAGLIYELLVTPRELPSALAAVRELPQLHFVLDHGAKPLVATGEWQPWAGQLRALAQLPNVDCKLSGLVTEAEWASWTAERVLPYAGHILDVFGPDRVLYGSDWPVCELAASYGQVLDLAERAVDALGLVPAERAAVFGGNAARTYGLTPGSGDS